MAKIVKRYKNWTIKETTPRDGENVSKYWLFLPDADLHFDSPEWECDSLEEAKNWIDCYDKPKQPKRTAKSMKKTLPIVAIKKELYGKKQEILRAALTVGISHEDGLKTEAKLEILKELIEWIDRRANA